MNTQPSIARRHFLATAAASAGSLLMVGSHRSHAAPSTAAPVEGETDHFWYRLAPDGPVGASTRAGGGMFVVVDLSDPSSPRQVAALPFAPSDGWGPNGLTVAGNVAFLAGGQSVEAIDIQNPDHPIKLASQRFLKELANANPRYFGGGDSGHDLVYRDGYLYVTGQNDYCLLILRVESNRIRELANP